MNFLSLELIKTFLGDVVIEWLERRTCIPEAPSSSLALAASWICSR